MVFSLLTLSPPFSIAYAIKFDYDDGQNIVLDGMLAFVTQNIIDINLPRALGQLILRLVVWPEWPTIRDTINFFVVISIASRAVEGWTNYLRKGFFFSFFDFVPRSLSPSEAPNVDIDLVVDSVELRRRLYVRGFV